MTTHKISYTRTPEEELRSRLHTHLQQDGGNPSQLLEMLDLAVSKEVWKDSGMSFRQFIETAYGDGGLGWSIENLKSVLKLKHRYEYAGGRDDLVERLALMRQTVVDLLNEPINPNGTNQHSERVLRCNTLDPTEEARGNSADYTIRRLKRDNPELAKRVVAGELSPNAAAIEAGFRKRTYHLPSDAEAAGRYLAERVDEEWMTAMFETYTKAVI